MVERRPPASRREVKKMKYCPDCGRELDEKGTCTECGFDTTENLEDEDDDEDD